jgi:hypothetical protein
MKLEFSRHIFEKSRNIKFREKPFSGTRVVPCGQMDGQPAGRTDMTLTVDFHNFAIPPPPKEKGGLDSRSLGQNLNLELP